MTRDCRYCGRSLEMPCMNTRDMTDAAIDGDEECFAGLAKVGWGESGERYVRENKVAKAAARAALRPSADA